MALHILNQLPDLFASVVTGTLIMDIAKSALNWIGAWTIGRQVEQLKPGVGREPPLDLACVVNLGIVGDDREVREKRRGVRLIKGLEQVKKEPALLAIPDTMGDGPGGDVQGASQVALLVGSGCQDFHLFSLGHPLIPNLGQQIKI